MQIFFWIQISSILILLGLAFFSSGFFLTRNELKDLSTCQKQQDVSSNSVCNGFSTSRRQKVIIIVIDALRLDFILPNTLKKLHDESADDKSSNMYLNKLVTLRNLLLEKPDHTFISRLDADPPTTTMQRLKGISTGGLPTFIDIKDDVASEKISEDNIWLQLKKNKKRITFMGDDTWMNLFPDELTKSYPYESFNVKDLDTLDNGVLSHLVPELEKDDFDVLIAHFLGVDHAGHRYGPRHSEMTRKLIQMDNILDDLINRLDRLDKDSILLVLGDHGMTEDGNHGGATEEERSAALFAYSSKKKFRKDLAVGEFEKDEIFTVQQIDLAPTLAMLLDVPIPFGNLGFIIPELMNSNWRELIDIARFNANQILSYLRTYQDKVGSGVSQQMLKELEEAVSQQTNQLNEKEHFLLLRNVSRKAAEEARALWTHFHYPLMICGIIFCFLGCLIFVAVFNLDHPEDRSWIAFLNVREDTPKGLWMGWILSLLSLTSNSYIISEGNVSLFVVATSVLLDRNKTNQTFALFCLNTLIQLLLLRLTLPLGEFMRSNGHEVRNSYFWILHAGIPAIYICAVNISISRRIKMSSAYVGINILQCFFSITFWFCSSLKVPGNMFAQITYLLILPGVYCANSLDQALTIGLIPLALVLGPYGPLAIVGFLLASGLCMDYRYSTVRDVWKGVAIAQLSILWFFATGHTCVFGTLRITAPYVGFEEFGYWRGVIMLSIDTFAPYLLGISVACTISHQALLGYLCVFATRAFVTTCFVYFTRRHLMLWAIFAPKFVFDASTFLACCGFAFTVESLRFGLSKWNVKKVE